MYFLKKIYVAVKETQAREELEQWQRVQQQQVLREANSIPLVFYEEEEVCKIIEHMECQSSDCGDTLHLEKNWGKEDGDAVLWITDDTHWAKKLSEAGKAVLAYLHTANEGQNFSCCKYAMMNPRELDVEYFELIYRRIRRLPWDILETERCYLRESIVEDVDDFYEIYKEPTITAYLENLFPAREQERAYIEDYIDKVYAFYDFGIWTVVEKGSGQVIGRAGLAYREGYEEPELGFVIGVPWQGQGLAYEVCAAVLDYGVRILEFHCFQALVEPENTASLHLCNKLGFQEVERIYVEDKEYIRLIAEM